MCGFRMSTTPLTALLFSIGMAGRLLASIGLPCRGNWQEREGKAAFRLIRSPAARNIKHGARAKGTFLAGQPAY